MLRKIIATIVVLAAAAVAPAAQAERFEFVALGDTAYNPPGDYALYDALIAKINAARPAFSIHVGDTWGAEACTEAQHRLVLSYFEKYEQPVVYTPGDNEVTDCRQAPVIEAYKRFEAGHASPTDLGVLLPLRQFDNAFAGAGYGDPIGSLAMVRRIFFQRPESLGRHPMPLVRQSDVSAYPTAENTRWEKGGVIFATVDVPGSGNGLTMNDEVRAREAISRNKANVEWIKALFAEAKAKDAKAVVIAMQAAMFEPGRGDSFTGHKLRDGQEGPYYWIAFAIRDYAAKFGKPVLVINGDDHDLIVDRPFMVSQGETKPALYANITRLQVFGAPELKSVRVTVDTDKPWVFGFEPLY